MTKVVEIEPFLEQFKLSLRSNGKMSPDEIEVYILGLKKGIITSTDIEENIPHLRLTTAGGILKRLSNMGFFKFLPDSDSIKKGGRGKVKKYKVIPPGVALRPAIEEQKRMTKVIEKIDEYLEFSEVKSDTVDDDLWVTRHEDAAISTFANGIRKATQSIKIYSHDCSWANAPDVMNALRDCQYRNIPVHVVASNPGKREKENLKKLSLKLNFTKVYTSPFIIIDDTLLMLPYKRSALGSRYSLMETRNKYWVENHMKLFGTLYNRQSSKGSD